MSKLSFYIPSLDGMRAVAILIVFLAHVGLDKIVPGGLGVTIFFFLSGYLITTLLRRELAKSGRIDFKQFYIRRMLRIWPSFYLVLALGALLTLAGLLPGPLKPGPLLSQVLHYANYYSIFSGSEGAILGTAVFWSLAVEEHFYLAFPLLYLVLVRLGLTPRRQGMVIGLLCLGVLAWRCFLVLHLHVDDHRTYYATDTRVDSIMFGCILAIRGNPMLDPHQGSEKLWKFVLLPAGLVLLAATLLYRSPDFRETLRYSLHGLALFPVFVTALRYPEWGPMRLLNSSALRLIGQISFPFYLVHFTVIRAFVEHPHPLPPLAIGILSFLISFALAYAIYRFVEQPVARIRKKHQV